MISSARDRVFREAGGRIIAALVSRFRELALAEDSFSEACARALEVWPATEVPRDPAAWLYKVALRAGFDALRRRQTHARFALRSHEGATTDDDTEAFDALVIPDERLRLIFICCHPAVGIESRAALALRLVCGLPTREIARAFLIPETTLEQRLVRAKRKIAEAGVPFEVPAVIDWPDRLDAVLSTLEVAYTKSHEDAAGTGPHAAYALEVLELSRTLAQLLPTEPEVLALAALIHFAESRRPARLDGNGEMIPIADQDPLRWHRPLIGEAAAFLARVPKREQDQPRVMQARLQAIWCARRSLQEPPPWPEVLAVYDSLLKTRDDAVVRLNRLVALAEVSGIAAATAEFEAVDGRALGDFAPHHAVRADLLRRAGRVEEAQKAYGAAIALVSTSAERRWLIRRANELSGAARSPISPGPA